MLGPKLLSSAVAAWIVAGTTRALAFDIATKPGGGDKGTKSAILAITLVVGAIFVYLKFRPSRDLNAELSTALREAKERALREAGKKPD